MPRLRTFIGSLIAYVVRRPPKLLYAYHWLATGSPYTGPDDLAGMRQSLTAWAADDGWALAEVWIEVAAQPSTVLQAMIESAQRRGIATIVIPTIGSLGPDNLVRRTTWHRLQAADLGTVIADVGLLHDTRLVPEDAPIRTGLERARWGVP